MDLRDVLRVAPGSRFDLAEIDLAEFDLAEIDPDGTPGLPRVRGSRKRWARSELVTIGADLATRQEQLYATAKVSGVRDRLLLVLQAMDCGGKDGTVKKVAGMMNPQGMSIVSFGPPTARELAHDFLWRVRKAVPVPGRVGVFNRSHYEDVLAVRVHESVPKRIWRARYAKINEFEQALVDDHVTIIKVMLHISMAEQAKRLSRRLADPTKYWKYNAADIDERSRWSDYQAAYTEALRRCSTEQAPWYVVPANRRWYRDWAVATLLAETLAGMPIGYPAATFNVDVERARLAATLSQDERKVNSA